MYLGCTRVICAGCGKIIEYKDNDKPYSGDMPGICNECYAKGNKMATCIKIDKCQKIKRVMSKDLAGDWQYAEAIKSVCAKCKDKVVK